MSSDVLELDPATTRGADAVPRPRVPPDPVPDVGRSPEQGPLGSRALRAEVRPAALASGDVPRLAPGECHDLGLALDAVVLAEAPAGPFAHGIEVREHGVDLRGTLVARAAGLYGLPVVEVLGVPVLLLHRRVLPPMGARIVASGFLSVERRLWAGTTSGCRSWRVESVRREHLAGLTATGFVVGSTALERLPAAADVDVRDQYVVDLRPC